MADQPSDVFPLLDLAAVGKGEILLHVLRCCDAESRISAYQCCKAVRACPAVNAAIRTVKVSESSVPAFATNVETLSVDLRDPSSAARRLSAVVARGQRFLHAATVRLDESHVSSDGYLLHECLSAVWTIAPMARRLDLFAPHAAMCRILRTQASLGRTPHLTCVCVRNGDGICEETADPVFESQWLAELRGTLSTLSIQPMVRDASVDALSRLTGLTRLELGDESDPVHAPMSTVAAACQGLRELSLHLRTQDVDVNDMPVPIDLSPLSTLSGLTFLALNGSWQDMGQWLAVRGLSSATIQRLEFGGDLFNADIRVGPLPALKVVTFECVAGDGNQYHERIMRGLNLPPAGQHVALEMTDDVSYICDGCDPESPWPGMAYLAVLPVATTVKLRLHVPDNQINEAIIRAWGHQPYIRRLHLGCMDTVRDRVWLRFTDAAAAKLLLLNMPALAELCSDAENLPLLAEATQGTSCSIRCITRERVQIVRT